MPLVFTKANRIAQRRFRPAPGPMGRQAAAAACGTGALHVALARGKRRPAGFSLIEVMVTLVVLGVGMLGLAALQITGMRVNDGALMRTRAVMAATDLADRARAQPDAFRVGAQGGISLSAGACGTLPECADPVSCWKRDFCGRYQPADGPQELPSPSSGAMASLDCGGGGGCGNGNCAISIRWSDERAGRSDPGGARDLQFRFCTRMPITP